MSALINPASVVWQILATDNYTFLVPEIAIDELKKYEELIKEKLQSDVKREAYSFLIAELFDAVVVVPTSKYRDSVTEAYDLMHNIDEKDTEFVALALQYNCPLWSDDKDLQQQTAVTVQTSSDIVAYLLS